MAKQRMMCFYNGNEFIMCMSIDEATTETVCATKDWLASDFEVDASEIKTSVEYR